MKPILYSYRRCPYAMRARMSLKYAGIEVEHREIELRKKPESMLLLSPKGTVPVLSIEGRVLEQSLEIMHWALMQSDPDGWTPVDEFIAQAWVEKNDGPFKTLLDQYKYPNRHPELRQAEVLNQLQEIMLKPMEATLAANDYLMGARITWVDIAIFPFIRQLAAVNPQLFESLQLPLLKRWLNQHLQSELFNSVMDKHPTWVD
ncbi:MULTISPECIES: glutathione S-transferase [unclassified Polynucleobacter]|uniref:glutathione S-transferase n=1 Tax=unclassified Polynucleobacter TaxID=2640945 RepID=UPI0025DE512C|nr:MULTISPECIES: glutathione S-transferase [unclassified Polynucleobacter]